MSARVVVDTGAIADSIGAMRGILGVDVLGVVKADGYGHGAVVAAHAMLDGGATWLGTADIREALAVRAAGIDAPMLAWLHSASPDFSPAAAAGIDVGVSGMQQLEAAGAAGATVHLKIDTGLGRNGVAPAEWQAVVERADALQRAGRIIVRGIFSHVAGTSGAADAEQLAAFEAACDAAAVLEPELTHLAASAAGLTLPAARRSMVRVGIAGYGIHPDGTALGAASGDFGAAAAAIGLRPAMRLEAETTAPGVLPIGIADGLLPAPGAPVLVGGRIVAVERVGAFETTLAAPATGTAVLWGDPARGEPSADAWAHAAGTIGYETVARVRLRPAQGGVA